jgi:hypothetical protein
MSLEDEIQDRLVARAFVTRFVDLGWSIDGMLNALPDEGEAALEGGFSLLIGSCVTLYRYRVAH